MSKGRILVGTQAYDRRYANVYICYNCGAKNKFTQSDMQKAKGKKKPKCRKCGGISFRPKRGGLTAKK